MMTINIVEFSQTYSIVHLNKYSNISQCHTKLIIIIIIKRIKDPKEGLNLNLGAH